MGQHEIVIGYAESDRVVVTVVGRMNPEAHDYWDGNWLTTPIYLEVGRFTGEQDYPVIGRS